MSCLNRRLESQWLYQPVPVVESVKLLQCPDQFWYGLEVPGPQQLLLERPEESFNKAVPFRLANECLRRLDPQEGELILEVVTHELRGMIVPALESLGGHWLEPSEMLMEALAEGCQGLEAGGPLEGMNAQQ